MVDNTELNSQFLQVIEHDRGSDTVEASMAFIKGQLANASFMDQIMPTQKLCFIVQGEHERHDHVYSVQKGDTLSEYLISIDGKSDTTYVSSYKIRLASPPHPTSPALQDINSWKTVDVVQYPQIQAPDVSDLPYDVQETLGEAFSYACAHWFFKGH